MFMVNSSNLIYRIHGSEQNNCGNTSKKIQFHPSVYILKSLVSDKMTSRGTSPQAFALVPGLSDGGRSITKNMAQKSGLPIEISSSNLAYVLISFQRLQKAREKRNTRFGLSSTLTVTCLFIS